MYGKGSYVGCVMKNGIIYVATNVKNGKQYIGQTINKLDKRIRGHYSDSKRHDYLFGRALKKYNKKDWDWDILSDDVPISELDRLERLCISSLSTLSPRGYNTEHGGNKNKVISEETRKKISLSKKGQTSWNKGKRASDETRRKQSYAKNGENNPMYGRKRFFTKETIDKISKSKAKKVYKIITPSGEIEIIQNLRKYCIDRVLDPSAMYKVANGKATHHKYYKIEK